MSRSWTAIEITQLNLSIEKLAVALGPIRFVEFAVVMLRFYERHLAFKSNATHTLLEVGWISSTQSSCNLLHNGIEYEKMALTGNAADRKLPGSDWRRYRVYSLKRGEAHCLKMLAHLAPEQSLFVDRCSYNERWQHSKCNFIKWEVHRRPLCQLSKWAESLSIGTFWTVTRVAVQVSAIVWDAA